MIALAYWLALVAVAYVIVQRGVTPTRFLFWLGLCDLAGFLIVTALLGWAFTGARRLREIGPSTRPSPRWFVGAQAVLCAFCALVAIWVSLDISFDGMGRDVALFGLGGRRAGCSATLMLLGTAVLMAWQTAGPTRAIWQYAAFASGILFTSSLGWSRIEASAASGSPAGLWLARGETLLVSAGMMTLMTGYGLARFLPADTDWVPRARRAMPVCAAIALLMLVLVLLHAALHL